MQTINLERQVHAKVSEYVRYVFRYAALLRHENDGVNICIYLFR